MWSVGGDLSYARRKRAAGWHEVHAYGRLARPGLRTMILFVLFRFFGKYLTIQNDAGSGLLHKSCYSASQLLFSHLGQDGPPAGICHNLTCRTWQVRNRSQLLKQRDGLI